MEKKMNTDETLAVILSNVKSLASHFKIDKRRPSGDDPAAEQADESKEQELLRGISDTVERIAAEKNFTAEQVAAMDKIAVRVENFLNGGQVKNQIELKSLLDVISKTLDQRSTAPLPVPQQSTVRHEYSFAVDFKNSKAAITIILMGLIILLLAGVNIWQADKNNILRDNDVKYRYVRMREGASPEDLYRLENVFHFNRNKDSVRLIRRQVDHFERLVKERAEKIEQARLDAARARQLHDEAETIKKKR